MVYFGVAVVPLVSTAVGTLTSGLGETFDPGGRDPPHARLAGRGKGKVGRTGIVGGKRK